MGLCSLVLGTTASSLGNSFVEENEPDAWKRLRFFLHSALVVNLTGTFMCLMITKMCSDLRLTVYEKKGSTRSTIYKDGTVSALLDKYHMSRWYWPVNALTIFVSALGWVFTFVTLALWANLSQPIGWLTMTFYGYVAVISIFVFMVASLVQEWS
jgi:hypothetical protein